MDHCRAKAITIQSLTIDWSSQSIYPPSIPGSLRLSVVSFLSLSFMNPEYHPRSSCSQKNVKTSHSKCENGALVSLTETLELLLGPTPLPSVPVYHRIAYTFIKSRCRRAFKFAISRSSVCRHSQKQSPPVSFSRRFHAHYPHLHCCLHFRCPVMFPWLQKQQNTSPCHRRDLCRCGWPRLHSQKAYCYCLAERGPGNSL